MRKPINLQTDQLDIVADQIEKAPERVIPPCYLKPPAKVTYQCDSYADIETPGHPYLMRYSFKHQRGVEMNEQSSALQKAIYELQH